MEEADKHLAVFRGKSIRKTFHHGEWWFVINDVVAVLTESTNPADYLKNMRKRDPAFGELYSKGGGQIDPPLLLEVETVGGNQKLRCWNTEALFRMVQSMSSPNAEPFKAWLAKVGYERVQEIEDPERATRRTRELYKAKGYSDDWIERRLRGIVIREELTGEWDKRSVKQGQEYSILTSEIARATFGVTPGQHKKLKGLQRENLRDHMSPLELVFTMLGEASTTEIARVEDKQGFPANKDAAQRGGNVAGDARKQLESETGQPIVNSANFLAKPKARPKDIKRLH